MTRLETVTGRPSQTGAALWIAVCAIACLTLAPMAQAAIELTPDADAYIQAGAPDDNVGASFALNAKEAGANAIRKIYIRFDLSTVSDPVQDAELQLQVRANNSDAILSFNVYGLNDGHAGENWVEGTGASESSPAADGITWNNAPANDSGNDIDLAGAPLLGTFTVDDFNSESVDSIVSFSNADSDTLNALINFINADTDGLITFIITRVDGGSTPNTVFDSKEPQAGDTPQAPTLVLTTQVIPEPGAAALMGLASLALLRRRRR